MSVPLDPPPDVSRPGRRALLRWSGISAFAAITNGYFANPASAQPGRSTVARRAISGSVSRSAAASSGSWTFDTAMALFVQPPATVGTAAAWEFNTDGDAEGWQPTHGVAPFTVEGGTLRTTVNGLDPYVFAPPVRLTGRRDRLLRIRARASAGDRLGLYFATEESPNLAEDKMIPVPLPMDGEFHELALDLGVANDLWRSGTVTTIRFDVEPAASEGVVLEIDHVRVERLGARLAATVPAISAGSVMPGEEFSLTTTVSNVGGEASDAFPAEVSLPAGVTALDPARIDIPALDAGAEVRLAWKARLTEAVPGAAAIDLAAPGGAFSFGTVIPAVPDAELGSRWSPAGVQVFRDDAGNAYLQNAGLRLALLTGPHGFAQARLAVRDAGTWRLMASSQPLTWISVQGPAGPELLPVVPDQVRLESGRQGSVVLTGVVRATDGTRWDARLSYSLGADDAFVKVTYSVTPDRDSDLLAFRGPSLTAGERSFGEAQDMALFPGLEWIVAGERSSGTLDADPPHNLRSTPHPLKMTVPLLALIDDGALVSLQWDTNQAWDGKRRHPSPRFASPNWLDGQRNHALTLFVPDSPDLVAENAPWATVRPYAAAAGRTLRVSAEFVTEVTSDVLRALDHWYAVYGLPEPAAKPFGWEQELELISDAYVTSYWDPDVKGWPHVYGWEPQPFVPLAAVLQIAGLLTSDPQARRAAFDRVREFTENVLQVKGAGALGELDGAHITMFHAPFYLGHLEGALPRFREQMRELMADQRDDGSWRFDPGDDPGRQRLGSPGAEGLGLTAVPAQRLLRYARLTGDADALAAGLKALTYMEKFDVPRAAQTWEVPVHTPDVLASAYGAGAYAEGYRLTGRASMLHRAEYWARTGLPFLYAWSDPERPMMPYASIPVFGATAFVLPWFGRPVQWNGLVYAYFLLDLLDAGGGKVRFPWHRVAEGLVVSAMHEQRTEEPAKGGYPDVWELVENVPIKNVDINPEGLAKPALMLMGRPTDVQTALLRRSGELARLSTAAVISGTSWTESALSARLGFYAGATSHLMVVGVPAPRNVIVDGRILARVASLDNSGVSEGWKRLADGTVLVKLRHAVESVFEVRF